MKNVLKKKYEVPEIKVSELHVSDIILASGTLDFSDKSPLSKGKIDYIDIY